jgi:O-acetyl-ADP-ribose deacetylase (regulator of RNase III)
MAPKFIFYDYDEDIIIEMMAVLDTVPNSTFLSTSVESMLDKNLGLDVIISPANSFITMGGGIDYILKKLFPDVDKKVKAIMNTEKLGMTSDGECYLPVGKCIIVPTDDKRCPFLASAPTMFEPEYIVGTNNVYKSFLAVLNKIGQSDMTIACCGLGTGVGGMSGTECATQIKKAYEQFYNVIL